MKNITTITRNIEANKDLIKNIKSNNFYTVENFISDAKEYIKAIEQNKMLCIIPHVSKSGMSRVLKFHSCEKSKNGFYYRQYYVFFKSLGYKYNKTHNGFNINGCGMDMVFNTNYNIIHDLKRLGFINEYKCNRLAQQTPTVL
jgi:hypothetical protein